jgi:hypothetical protein
MIERPRSIEATDIVLIDESTISEAEQYIVACENCAYYAGMALEYVLDTLTACDPSVTQYVMIRPARCPLCSNQITEKTLVAV